MSRGLGDVYKRQVRLNISLQEKREAQLKQTLQQAMEDATRAKFANGQITWKKSKDSVALNMALLLQEKPDLQAKYPLLKPGSRRFLIN